MNLTVNSDQAVTVKVIMTFTDMNVFEFHMDLTGYCPVQYCVVGRSPHQVAHMELEYNGRRFGYPIEAQGNDLKEIDIYGGRDRWSQLLREAALAHD